MMFDLVRMRLFSQTTKDVEGIPQLTSNIKWAQNIISLC